MWETYKFHRWLELDAVVESTDVGRRLDIGGFVLFNCDYATTWGAAQQAYLADAPGGAIKIEPFLRKLSRLINVVLAERG